MAVMRSSGPLRSNADTRRSAWWPLALLCMGQFALVLNFQVVTIALPSIDRGLDLSAAGLQWVINANALAFGGLLLLAGRLSDLYGARRIFLAGLVLFAAASLGCALAVAPAQMIAARAAQGAGAALTAASSLALLTGIYVEGPERTRALGFWGASGPLGGAAGIVVGGALASTLGWRALFLLLVPVALLPVLLAPGRLPHIGSRRAAGRGELDILGAVVGTAACVALVYALMSAASGFGVATLAALAAAILLGALLILIERRTAHPLFPFAELRRPPLPGATLVSLLFAATTNTPIFFYVLHLQEIDGRSALLTGLLFLPCDAAVIAGAAFGARLAARCGARPAAAIGMGLVAAGLLPMARLPLENTYVLAYLPGFVIEGFGLGITQVAVIAAGTAGAAERVRGFASGLLNSSAQIGTALGLALLVAVATWGDTTAVSNPTAGSLDGFRRALFTGSVLAAATAVLSLIVLARRGASSSTSDTCG